MDLPTAWDIENGGIPEWGPRVDILLDGVLQKGVTMFDCAKGEVRRNKMIGNNYVIVDEQVIEQTMHGEVTVQLKEQYNDR